MRTPWSSWWKLDRADFSWMLGLVILAGVLRFGSPFFPDILTSPTGGRPVTAWGIWHSYKYSTPQERCDRENYPIAPCTPFVFDELYFATDANKDVIGQDYLDPEPPLAKLIIALGIKLFGFTELGWRVMPALFGTLLIPLLYLLARQLFPARFAAVAAGLLATFDGMLFVESRTAVIDIFPVVFVVASYLLLHLHLRADTALRQRGTIVLMGLMLGLGLGAKWTALAAYGTVVLILAIQLVRRRVRYQWATAAVVLVSLGLLPAGVYALSFTRYLTITHDIGLQHLPAALMLSPLHLDPGQAWQNLAAFHRWTFDYHYHLREPHPYYSPWYSWPVLYRPVAFYYQGEGLGNDAGSGTALVAEIFNLGNPVIWWASLPALLALIAFAVRYRSYPAVFILLAFAAAWLPFALIPRGLFLYHMLGGLPLMILALASGLGELWTRSIRLRSPILAYLGLVLVAFLFFYPLWAGLPLTSQGVNARIWFPSWV